MQEDKELEQLQQEVALDMQIHLTIQGVNSMIISMTWTLPLKLEGEEAVILGLEEDSNHQINQISMEFLS